jgi:hypothetical protein
MSNATPNTISLATASSHIRHQKKNQTARQAMMISGLQTIYRNNSATNAIQKNIRSETRIYLLDITIADINEKYSKIHQIIETGRLKPKGTEQYFVKKQHEHLLVTENGIYEIKTSTNHNNSNGCYNKNNNKHNGNGASVENTTSHLQKKSIVDGVTNTIEVNASIISENKATQKQLVIPVLVDESYYQQSESSVHHIPIEHSYIIQVKKTVRFHNNAPNAFVFVFDENEKQILDFYMTTDNGIIKDKLSTSFKDDMISFLLQFKLY